LLSSYDVLNAHILTMIPSYVMLIEITVIFSGGNT